MICKSASEEGPGHERSTPDGTKETEGDRAFFKGDCCPKEFSQSVNIRDHETRVCMSYLLFAVNNSNEGGRYSPTNEVITVQPEKIPATPRPAMALHTQG